MPTTIYRDRDGVVTLEVKGEGSAQSIAREYMDTVKILFPESKEDKTDD